MLLGHGCSARACIWIVLASTTCAFARTEGESQSPKGSPDSKQAAPAASGSAQTAAVPAAEKAKKELNPAMVALRNQVRNVLTQHQRQPFNTRDNSPADIMAFCLGFGCDTEVSLDGAGGKRLNGVTCLCWNYPCGGFEMLMPAQRHIVARVGYGGQAHPGQFIAMLAMSRVPETYPIHCGKNERTIAELIEAEKLACRDTSDLSLPLIGLTYYAESPTWKNDVGEDWALERMVQQTMAQSATANSDAGLNRLLGLSYAVRHRVKNNLPIDGQFQRAQKYIGEFGAFALGAQNPDGSWGPQPLSARSASADAATQLWSTGRMLEWLVLALPDDRLEEARVVRAVEQASKLLVSPRYQRNVPMLPTKEIDAVGHALHALAIYDDRVFKPADVEEKPAAEPASKAKPATASRASSAAKSQ